MLSQDPGQLGVKTQFRGRRKIIIVTFDIKIPGLCQPEVIEGHPGVAVEHLVPVIVPEDELLPGLQRGHGVVALEPLAVGGEVVQDPGTRLRAQLPGPGGQVNKVGFLPTTLASRAAIDPSVITITSEHFHI